MKMIYLIPKPLLVLCSLALSVLSISAANPPKQLGAYLEKNKPVRGEIVQLDVPAEFRKFELVLLKAKEKDPKWFSEHIAKSGKDSTIPDYHKKLGITKSEYNRFIKIWGQRKYKKVEDGDVQLMLTEDADKNWIINVSGKGVPISLIKYIPAEDTFKSSNGMMKRIEDIDSPADSIYRAWKGHEWRYFHETPLLKVKENLAIGRTADTRYGILIYSLQEVTSEGTPLADRLMIIRFVPKKLK